MRSSRIAALFVVALTLAACGGSDDDDDIPGDSAQSTATTMTSTGSALPSPRPGATTISGFVISDDQRGPGVWREGEPITGVAVGVLCDALGGLSELAVNTRGATAATAFGRRMVGITRNGVWVLWLSPASAEALARTAPATVANREPVARIEQSLSVEANAAYFGC